MVPVLTAAQMRQADRRTIDEIGLPGAVLMENAGAAVAAEIIRRRPEARRVVVLCGKGNNGGDGFVVARRLLHLEPLCLLLGARGDVAGDARVHLEAFERSGGRVRDVRDLDAWTAHLGPVGSADVLVDALLGTGLTESPRNLVAHVLEDLLKLERRPWTIAVDVPSGVSSDGGTVPGVALSADVTVTFGALKHGHVLSPASDRCGEVVIADIGIPRSALEAAAPTLFRLGPEDVRAAWPPRAADSHKGTYGHVLVVGGSVGKTGAVALCATAALRAGAGLVTAAVPAPVLGTVAASRTEIMTEPLPATPDGALDASGASRVLELAAQRDAVVLGPGAGTDPATVALVRRLVAECAVPVVLDADALNALAPLTAAIAAKGPRVLTPHPGEMGRLAGRSTADVQGDRLSAVRALAHAAGAVVALKGHRTLVAAADGRVAVNTTGNPGMATGGTGDVLAGVIGALLARGVEPWRATGAAVQAHGRAGDIAASRVGAEGLVAGDLLDALPEALRTA